MDQPTGPSPLNDAAARRTATGVLVVALALLGVSIFLIAAERSSSLVIIATILCAAYSGYLFYQIYRK